VGGDLGGGAVGVSLWVEGGWGSEGWWGGGGGVVSGRKGGGRWERGWVGGAWAGDGGVWLGPLGGGKMDHGVRSFPLEDKRASGGSI